MGQGLRIWDASGNLVLDASDRIMTVLGRVDVTSTTPGGSVTVSDPRLAFGERWHFVTTDGGGWGGATSISVTSTSSAITATVTNPEFIPGTLTVTYGVY